MRAQVSASGKRPLALDLYCGAGGASMGLYRAGFDVIGVDLRPQPKYPFALVRGDALRPPVDLSRFDFIWASPPCQAYTALRKMWNSRQYEDLIPQTRALLIASGKRWVMENVPGAPLEGAFMLCGTMFGLGTKTGAELRRHRYFEQNWFIGLTPQCQHSRARVISVTGNGPHDARSDHRVRVVRNQVRETFTADDARDAMGCDWMTMRGLSQAIPPAYSEFIGRAALCSLGLAEAA